MNFLLVSILSLIAFSSLASVRCFTVINSLKRINRMNKVKNFHANDMKKHLFGNEPNEPPLTLRQKILRALPVGAFMLSFAGICFQVFVLYPWHEELSAEFKDLESSIITLNATLKKFDPDVDVVQLDRETDKYVKGIESYSAGPRVSKFMPSFLIEKSAARTSRN